MLWVMVQFTFFLRLTASESESVVEFASLWLIRFYRLTGDIKWPAWTAFEAALGNGSCSISHFVVS